MRTMNQIAEVLPNLAPFESLALSVAGLTLSRGDLCLISDLDLRLSGGDAVFLMGANGSGKTTFLHALAGLVRPDQGTIMLGDRPLDLEASEWIGWLGHVDGLKPNETVRETLRFWAGLQGERKPPIMAVLKALDIGHLIDRPTGRLSRGQQRRVAFARVAVANRPLWLLDEPAGPLDQRGRDRLAELVAWHRDRGGIVIAATHQILDWPGAETLELSR
ncbi:heme ABC exporter ATP-binding protein CcmA [Maricaulis sp.]|uniref:heme ABC exporter ATP-binding protein CcmA n=1 Tax=Maricaulis sp. TaxID=1486257 RepID=UPI00260B1A5E|nr:heme ABC exporter ATP-binding protein CcmA [Maricaulis sp.]